MCHWSLRHPTKSWGFLSYTEKETEVGGEGGILSGSRSLVWSPSPPFPNKATSNSDSCQGHKALGREEVCSQPRITWP